MPSAAAALALAKAFGCRVEDLFSLEDAGRARGMLGRAPATRPCRYWQADVGGRPLARMRRMLRARPVLPHDGVFDGRARPGDRRPTPRQTLVMACCDPAVGLLAHELARRAQIRLLVIPRSSRQALDLLRDGLVHVAGLHLSRAADDGNRAVREPKRIR